MTRRPLASLYVRLSKEAKASNTSRDGMIADLRALAEAHGFDVLAVHIDDGISGAVRDRPEFLAWLADGREGRADALLAYHGDRLTREGVNAAAMILDVIEGKDSETGAVVRKPVRFLSHDGLDSRDADGFRWRFVIAAEVARGERERIKARNLDAQRRLRDAQRFRGGSAPYGYRVVPNTGREGKGLALDPAEVRALRAAAEFVLGGGSLYGAVRLLNEQGAKPRRAKAWSVPSLRHVLTGEAVLGRMTHEGRVVRGEDGLPLAPWPEALPLADVERLRAIVDSNRLTDAPPAPRRLRASRLLSGLLVCSGCLGRLRVNKSRDVVRYACRGTSDGRGCTAPTTINAVHLEEHVERVFLGTVGRMEFMRQTVRVRESGDLAEVEESLRDLARQMTEPGADLVSLSAQITSLHARRAELEALPAKPEVSLEPTGLTFREVWEAAEVDERRTHLREALTGPIVVSRGTPRRKGLDLDRAFIPWAWLDETPEEPSDAF